MSENVKKSAKGKTISRCLNHKNSEEKEEPIERKKENCNIDITTET
jgi:hypothetical protein